METGNFSSPERQGRGSTSRRLKTACVIQLLALLAAWLPAVAQAQFLHTTNNGTITITGYTGPGGDVSIPDTINGWPVIGIGYEAFYSSTKLTGISIPNSVTSIEARAFYSATSLTNVTIGSGVTYIGGSAFHFCTSLKAITVNVLNDYYRSMDGILFNKSQTTLIQCPRRQSRELYDP